MGEVRQISYCVDIEWHAVGVTGRAMGAKIAIEFIAG